MAGNTTGSGVPRITRAAGDGAAGEDAAVASDNGGNSGGDNSGVGSDIMTVTGVMSARDIVDLRRIGDAQALAPRGWRAQTGDGLRWFAYIFGSLYALSFIVTGRQSFWTSFAALFLGLTIAGFIEPLFLRRRLNRAAQASTVAFQITETGFHYGQQHYSSQLAWPALTKVTVEPNWLILRFGDLTTYGVPSHLFDSVDQRRIWVEALNARLPSGARVDYRL